MKETNPKQQPPLSDSSQNEDKKKESIDYNAFSDLSDPNAAAWTNAAEDSQGEAWPQPQPIEKPLPPKDEGVSSLHLHELNHSRIGEYA